jgi:hypothetical protein
MNRVLTASLVAGVALAAAPSAALACNSSTSAVNVYKECLQTGGGGTPTGPPPSTGKDSSSNPSTTVSGPAEKALTKAGKDKGALTNLVNGYGLRRHLAVAGQSGAATTPSAVGSAFDLSSGPTALLIVLAATAALILGGSGMRVWRNRHRAS